MQRLPGFDYSLNDLNLPTTPLSLPLYLHQSPTSSGVRKPSIPSSFPCRITLYDLYFRIRPDSAILVLGRTATAELDPDGLMTPDLDLRRDSNHLLQFAADSNSDQISTADLSVARRIVATILADPQLDQSPTDIYPVELQAHPEGLPPQLAPQDRRFRSIADPEGITGGLGEKPLWLPMGVYEGSANRFAGGRPLPLHTTPTYYSFDIKMPSQYHIDVIDHRLKSGSLLKNQPEVCSFLRTQPLPPSPPPAPTKTASTPFSPEDVNALIVYPFGKRRSGADPSSQE